MAVASAGPYEDNLHLAPDTDNHTDTSSLMFTGQFFYISSTALVLHFIFYSC